MIVQGLGNVATTRPSSFRRRTGCRITAIIERDGALLKEDGLVVDEVREHIVDKGGLKGFPGADYVEDGAKVLEEECDILIPAALEGVIHRGNAAQIKAPLVIEAANGPVTFGADEILRQKGCVVIPDMYANAGGVTVSYFELGQEPQPHPLRAHGAPRRGGAPTASWSRSWSGSRPTRARAGRWGPSSRRATCAARASWSWCARGSTTPCAAPTSRCARPGTCATTWDDLRTAAFLVSIGRVADSYRTKGL